MVTHTISSSRLDLVGFTEALCIADMTSPRELSAHLNARIPDAWPPEQMDAGVYGTFLSLLQKGGDPGFYAFYWIARSSALIPERTLIGSGGFLFDNESSPELGYSVLPEFQYQGFATEAVAVMVDWLHQTHGISAIRASTYPHLKGSIRVLEKNGFQYVGFGSEEGTIVYLRTF